MEDNKHVYGFKYLIPAICFLTNLTQLPVIVDFGHSSIVSYILWAVALTYGAFVIWSEGLDKRILYLLVVLLTFLAVQGSMSIFVGKDLISSSLSTGFMSSIAVAILGIMFGKFYSEKLLLRTMKSYYISMVIVSISIYIRILYGSSFITSSQYAYESKNSISGIIAIGLLFFIIYKRSNNPFIRVLEYLSFAFSTYIFLGLKSRASILSLVMVILLMVMMGSLKRSTKFMIVGSALVLLLALGISESFRKILIDNILLTNRKFSLKNLDDVSSGRITILKGFFRLIRGHYITGIGDHYLESFYFAAILQHGIFGGLLIIFTAISPMITLFRKNWNNSLIYRLVVYVSLFFLLNGVFEGISPVGPGAKTYIMWLLFGISLSAYNQPKVRKYDYTMIYDDNLNSIYN